MFRRVYYSIILFITILSCNNPSANTNIIVSKDSANSPLQNLEITANEFYESEDYNMAIPYFDNLIAIDSANGEYYFKRGYCKTRLLNNDGAINDFNKAIEYNYQNKQSAYLNIGLIYRSRGLFENYSNRIVEFDSALHYYNLCLKLDPANKQAILEKEKVQQDLDKLR